MTSARTLTRLFVDKNLAPALILLGRSEFDLPVPPWSGNHSPVLAGDIDRSRLVGLSLDWRLHPPRASRPFPLLERRSAGVFDLHRPSPVSGGIASQDEVLGEAALTASHEEA